MERKEKRREGKERKRKGKENEREGIFKFNLELPLMFKNLYFSAMFAIIFIYVSAPESNH